MHYTFITPPASRASERPAQIDDALVAEARRVLQAAVETIPYSATLSRRASRALFAGPMVTLCDSVRRRGVPIEKVIIAVKLAWASLGEARLRLGDASPDTLTAAVSACIEAYYAVGDDRSARTDRPVV